MVSIGEDVRASTTTTGVTTGTDTETIQVGETMETATTLAMATTETTPVTDTETTHLSCDRYFATRSKSQFTLILS